MRPSIFKIVKSSLTPSQIMAIILARLQGGRIVGNKYYPINPTRNDTSPGSFVIYLDTGRYIEYATGEKGGDIIELFAYLNRTTPYNAALELLDLCYISPSSTNHYVAPKPSKAPNLDTQRLIRKIWGECRPAYGTQAETYLRSRGYKRVIADTIKYHPRLKHSVTSTYHPAMVAAITLGSSNDVIAVHRTFLKPDGSGKADIEPNKMMLGSVKGGSVKLGLLVGNRLAIAEGIETALSHYLLTGIPTWAALSAVSMQHIILPPPEQVRHITIATDNDAAGINAANVLANRLCAEGYIVHVTMPEQQGWDFNDVLLGGQNDC